MPAAQERKSISGGDREVAVRDGIMDSLQQSPATTVLSPAVIDKGHPAFIVGVSGQGMFMVTVQRISTAIAERVNPDGTDFG
jgi:hypothetical protein